MSDIIIGIDNGLTGGIVALSTAHGLIIDCTPMPTAKRKHWFKKTKTSVRKGEKSKSTDYARENEIDGASVTDWIRHTTNSKPCTILIEECPAHARQKSIMRSMAISYGILIGAVTANLPSYRLVVVRSGNSLDSWQRAMLGVCEQGTTKEVALAVAKHLWPNEHWLATPRSKTPHDGMIDAALIAAYGRINHL